MEFLSLGIKSPNVDLEGEFKSVARGRVNAFITVRNPVTQHCAEQIVEMYKRAQYSRIRL